MTTVPDIDTHQFSIIKRFGSLAFWLMCLSYELIVLGGIVRVTDSGLACPDWPMCFGKLIPVMDMQIFLEWFHRLTALVVGILMLGMCSMVFRFKIIKKVFSYELMFAVLLFLSQCILGGLTVLKLLQPSVVSLHLSNALLFFALLMALWAKASSFNFKHPLVYSKQGPIGSFKFLLLICTCILFGQLVLGGMVSTNHAGLVCPDFPKCHGMWVPPSSFLVNLQVFHRICAYLLLALALLLAIIARGVDLPKRTRLSVKIFPSLLALQIILGVTNVFLQLPMFVRVAHLANGVLIFAFLLSAIFELQNLKNIGLKPFESGKKV